MDVPEAFRNDIEEGQRLRGWIANSYAQIEFMLDDLILRCRVYPEYQVEASKKLTRSTTKRVQRVRSMLAKDGPLTPFAHELISILDRFDERHEVRNLLAHGFCEYLYTPDGDAGLHFQKWHHEEDKDDLRLVRTFRLSDLEDERRIFNSVSEEAFRLFIRMHAHFGWIARPDA